MIHDFVLKKNGTSWWFCAKAARSIVLSVWNMKREAHIKSLFTVTANVEGYLESKRRKEQNMPANLESE